MTSKLCLAPVSPALSETGVQAPQIQHMPLIHETINAENVLIHTYLLDMYCIFCEISPADRPISANQINITKSCKLFLEAKLAVVEANRIAAEANRIAAEANRIAAEAKLEVVEANRIADENNRIAAEANRIADENNRIAAEAKLEVVEANRIADENNSKFLRSIFLYRLQSSKPSSEATSSSERAEFFPNRDSLVAFIREGCFSKNGISTMDEKPLRSTSPHIQKCAQASSLSSMTDPRKLKLSLFKVSLMAGTSSAIQVTKLTITSAFMKEMVTKHLHLSDDQIQNEIDIAILFRDALVWCVSNERDVHEIGHMHTLFTLFVEGMIETLRLTNNCSCHRISHCNLQCNVFLNYKRKRDTESSVGLTYLSGYSDLGIVKIPETSTRLQLDSVASFEDTIIAEIKNIGNDESSPMNFRLSRLLACRDQQIGQLVCMDHMRHNLAQLSGNHQPSSTSNSAAASADHSPDITNNSAQQHFKPLKSILSDFFHTVIALKLPEHLCSEIVIDGINLSNSLPVYAESPVMTEAGDLVLSILFLMCDLDDEDLNRIISGQLSHSTEEDRGAGLEDDTEVASVDEDREDDIEGGELISGNLSKSFKDVCHRESESDSENAKRHHTGTTHSADRDRLSILAPRSQNIVHVLRLNNHNPYANIRKHQVNGFEERENLRRGLLCETTLRQHLKRLEETLDI